MNFGDIYDHKFLTTSISNLVNFMRIKSLILTILLICEILVSGTKEQVQCDLLLITCSSYNLLESCEQLSVVGGDVALSKIVMSYL